jgi:hypothetical protein
MRSRLSSVIALALVIITSGFASAPASGAQSTSQGSLKVTVNYTGKGSVDEKHQLFVWLFDTPNITTESMPIASNALTANNGTVDFGSLPEKVYIAAAYDEKGGYDGTTAPPSGTPVTVYGGQTSATAVATGDTAAVTVAFDDSERLP